MSKTIRKSLDLDQLPSLTEAQKQELRELIAAGERDIDYSDIPQTDARFWAQAQPNPFFKPTKEPTTIRVDSDVLAWLRAKGKGYQTRMNAILRQEMLRDLLH